MTDVVLDGLDFAEGPRWREGRLWFSDFFQHRVNAMTEGGEVEKMLDVPMQPSGLGWLPDGRLLVVSMLDRKVLRLDGDALVEHADLSRIAGGECNDMVVDAKGRAYVGNFGFDASKGEAFRNTQLALVHPDGRVEVAAEDMAFPNGTVLADEGRTLIIGETMGGRLTAFDVADDGSLSNRRVWATLRGVAPDGCCLDNAGGIWVANAAGKECVRVVEGGEVTDRIETSGGCFACMLGGGDGRTLFMLTNTAGSPSRAVVTGNGRIEVTRVTHPHAGLP